jgi:hypothetical protein
MNVSDVKGDRCNLFRVVDSSGDDFFVAADSFGDAEKKFKAWERTQYDDLMPEDELEEPQAIMSVGCLIITEHSLEVEEAEKAEEAKFSSR